jgi:hypothetical protein
MLGSMIKKINVPSDFPTTICLELKFADRN